MSNVNPREREEARGWSVCRQDDNGNRFVVATRLGREEAEKLAAELESREHKQTYWADENA
ncbi:MAG: hypothetical protein HYS13_17305 [Planctomycetia bacterium]|nr:hypothetical protein [Planctomycetia bacterium]